MANERNGVIFLSPVMVLPPNKELTLPQRLDSTGTETPQKDKALVGNTFGAVLGGTRAP